MLVFMDGVNHYNAATGGKKWNYAFSASVTAGQGRYGGNAVGANNSCATYLPTSDEYILGVAAKFGGLNQILFILREGSTEHTRVGITSGGFLYVTRGSTTIATGTTPLAINTYYYIEVRVYIHDSSGYAIVRLNENEEINISGTDTRNGGTGVIDNFQLGPGGGHGSYYCDIYACDVSGTLNNGFLGDVRVEAIFPNGDDTPLNWIPSTGSTHYNLVSGSVPDDDTTYVTTSGVSVDDIYTYGNLTLTSGAVLGIQMLTYDRKTDAGGVSLQQLMKLSGTVYTGHIFSEQDTYIYHAGIIEQNPHTSADWTIADINSASFGIRRI